MKADDLALIVRGMTPVVREFVAQQTQTLLTQMAVLEQRVLAAEQRAMTPGPQGEPGPMGPAGVGTDGKDGVSFLSGVGPPLIEGKAGDGYLDVKTGDVYQWR